MASSSKDSSLPINTLMHLITIKLSSSNYLLWNNQMLPILKYQNLLPHIDGSSNPPSETIITGDNLVPNPDYSSWVMKDQQTIIFLHASLTEEVVNTIIGLPTARLIWVTLENTYGNTSIDRVHNLRDQLRLLQKGTKSVAEFGRSFKSLCDQLAAINHPVDESDQVHWFLCGLGSTFETFSTAVRNSRPLPTFTDFLTRAENHELFLRTIHGSSTPPVAFSAQLQRLPSSSRGRGQRFTRGSSTAAYRGTSGGRSRGRRPPHCQLCRTDGHYTSACPSPASFANLTSAASSVDSFANAFLSQCHVTSSGPVWYVDSGATNHMTPAPDSVSNPTPATGSEDQASSSPRKM